MSDKKIDEAKRGFDDGRDGGGAVGRFLGESEIYYKNFHEGDRVRQEHGSSKASQETGDIVGSIIDTFSLKSSEVGEKGDKFKDSSGTGESVGVASNEKGNASEAGYCSTGGCISSGRGRPDSWGSTLMWIAGTLVASQVLAWLLIYVSIPMRFWIIQLPDPTLGQIILGIGMGLVGMLFYVVGFVMVLPSLLAEVLLQVNLTPSFVM